MKMIAISDTHNRHKNLVIPECDILLVDGDYTSQGYEHEVKEFHKWLNKQPARYKIVIQGNHEKGVEANFKLARGIAKYECPDVIFVEHELVVIEGIKIFCSAWTPWFYNWAYNAVRQREGATKKNPYIGDLWKDIPLDVDVIATHGPCHGFHDLVYQVDGVTPRERVGCDLLLQKVMQTNAKVIISGHIHSGHGFQEFNGKQFYGVSICDEMYYPSYKPTEIEL